MVGVSGSGGEVVVVEVGWSTSLQRCVWLHHRLDGGRVRPARPHARHAAPRAGHGGNTGSQSNATVIRALALGHLRASDWAMVVYKVGLGGRVIPLWVWGGWCALWKGRFGFLCVSLRTPRMPHCVRGVMGWLGGPGAEGGRGLHSLCTQAVPGGATVHAPAAATSQGRLHQGRWLVSSPF